MWGSEPTQQKQNFFGIIVLQFVVTDPVGLGFDFIMIVPLLLSHYGFFFVFGCRVFLVGSSGVFVVVVVNGYSAVVILLFS